MKAETGVSRSLETSVDTSACVNPSSATNSSRPGDTSGAPAAGLSVSLAASIPIFTLLENKKTANSSRK